MAEGVRRKLILHRNGPDKAQHGVGARHRTEGNADSVARQQNHNVRPFTRGKHRGIVSGLTTGALFLGLKQNGALFNRLNVRFSLVSLANGRPLNDHLSI